MSSSSAQLCCAILLNALLINGSDAAAPNFGKMLGARNSFNEAGFALDSRDAALAYMCSSRACVLNTSIQTSETYNLGLVAS